MSSNKVQQRANDRVPCTVSECNKRFRDQGGLTRHLSSSVHGDVPFSMYRQVPSAEPREPEITATIPRSVRLDRIVFHAANESSSEEDSDEDEPLVVSDSHEFTSSAREESDAEANTERDTEANSEIDADTSAEGPFEESVYLGEFYPFVDIIHKKLHEFYYKTGTDITQSLMTDIINLVKDVVNAKTEYPDAKVPAADHLFNFDKRVRNRIPMLKTTEHQVVIKSAPTPGQLIDQSYTFSMNAPSAVLELLVGNSQTVNKIVSLPDHTEGEMIESNQSAKWRYHEMFQHPMITTNFNNIERDFWVGDLVDVDGKLFMIARFFTVSHSTIMAEGYEINVESGRHFILAHQDYTTFKVENITTLVCNQPESLSLFFLPFVYQDQNLLTKCEAIRSRLVTLNPLKKPVDRQVRGRDYKRVKVVPINLFTDDMSGNRTKKTNKFDSWILVPAALPLKERHQLENTYFICTDHSLSAMQMLPAIVDDLVKLENGICMLTPDGESVVVTAPLQFITADNARHSEIASSRGAVSGKPCRKCDWELRTLAREDGTDYESSPRSESVVREMYERFLQSGGTNTSLLVDVNRGYKLVGGQALLRLKSFDTMLDCPIELLHTIMLGVGKSLVKSLLGDHLNADEKTCLEKFLFGYNSKGFSRKLRSALRLHCSFLGRDYKILIQQIPIALNQLIAQGKLQPSEGLNAIKTCFDNLGKLVSLVYISKIYHHRDMYITYVKNAINNLRYSVMKHDQFLRRRNPELKRSIYNLSKMHILYHLPDDIFRFGSPIFYETEKGEQFNKFIRECLFRTNRHNPSRDAAIAFAKRFMAKHIFTGGIWKTRDGILRKAAEKVLQGSQSVVNISRDYADNDDDKKVIKTGSSGLFENERGERFVGEVFSIDTLYDVVNFKVFSFPLRDGTNVHKLKPLSFSLWATLAGQTEVETCWQKSYQEKLDTQSQQFVLLKL